MRYRLDEETGEVFVEVSMELVQELAPFGGTWLAGDQWVLLGSPSGQADRRILGTAIPIGQARACLALRDKIRSERERSRTRFPRVGPEGPHGYSPPSPKGELEGASSPADPCPGISITALSSPVTKSLQSNLSEQVYYLRTLNIKTGKPHLPVPYKWHLCEECGEPSLVRHGPKSGKPDQGRCGFCGKLRVKKESA